MAQAVLDTYEPERIAFARRLVATTDQAFTGVTSNGMIARRVRLNVVPVVIPMIFRFPTTRRILFRTVSQTSVNYRGSSLSEGRAGPVYGGDRLPWVTADSSGVDNFTPLRSFDWQVHVYGDAAREMQAACRDQTLPLHVFPWRLEMGRAGLRRDAVYLVRPDGYVAVADRRVARGRSRPISTRAGSLRRGGSSDQVLSINGASRIGHRVIHAQEEETTR